MGCFAAPTVRVQAISSVAGQGNWPRGAQGSSGRKASCANKGRLASLDRRSGSRSSSRGTRLAPSNTTWAGWAPPGPWRRREARPEGWGRNQPSTNVPSRSRARTSRGSMETHRSRPPQTRSAWVLARLRLRGPQRSGILPTLQATCRRAKGTCSISTPWM
jgi:hypothetical protein